jgi:hypothetical protein
MRKDLSVSQKDPTARRPCIETQFQTPQFLCISSYALNHAFRPMHFVGTTHSVSKGVKLHTGGIDLSDFAKSVFAILPIKKCRTRVHIPGSHIFLTSRGPHVERFKAYPILCRHFCFGGDCPNRHARILRLSSRSGEYSLRLYQRRCPMPGTTNTGMHSLHPRIVGGREQE